MHRKVEIAYISYTWLFFTTGVFAIIGALFTWGKGWLFAQSNLSNFLIPLGDLILAGPLSLITTYGLWSKKNWAIYTGLLTSGIYIFGSVLVFISVIWNGSPYPIELVIPPVFGLAIGISFFRWVAKNNSMKKEQ